MSTTPPRNRPTEYGAAGHAPAVDAILGDQATRQMVKSLSTELLVPMAQRTGQGIGIVMDVDVYFVAPDFHYFRRMEILDLLDESAFTFYVKVPRTGYFRKAGGWLARLRKAMQYRRLYASIRDRGLFDDPDDVFSTPWLFASAECIYRLDGHHRSSIARHLGIQRIKTRVITPDDVLRIADLPQHFRAFAERLGQPLLDLTKRPSSGPSDAEG